MGVDRGWRLEDGGCVHSCIPAQPDTAGTRCCFLLGDAAPFAVLILSCTWDFRCCPLAMGTVSLCRLKPIPCARLHLLSVWSCTLSRKPTPEPGSLAQAHKATTPGYDCLWPLPTIPLRNHAPVCDFKNTASWGLAHRLNWLILYLKVLASHRGTSLCPNCSAYDLAPCLGPRKAVENNPGSLDPCTCLET